MTEQEVERLRQAKQEVSAWLAGCDIGRLRLGAVDPRVRDYVKGVAARPERHNLFEQLAVKKFLLMAGRYGIDAGAVRRFFAFYEALKFPHSGGMRSFRLTPVQAFQFCAIYGFWAGGRRVVREAVLYVPRKFSKTTGTASAAVYDLLFGPANGEAYVAANSADQAKKCFDVIRGCVRALDPYGKRYRVNKQAVESLRPDRQAFAQCLTANARTKDGLNASVVILDEFSQARERTLLDVLTTSMGARANPLTIIITTASDVFLGPFYSMLQGYKKMLLGDIEDDDSVFAHLFEPDVGDDEGAEQTWRKVHPHLGVTVGVDFYRQEWKKAQREGAEAMLAFRTKLLNVYAESVKLDTWLSAAEIRRQSMEIDLRRLRGRPQAMVAIDLSESRDFSAVTLGFFDEGRECYYFHTAYFFPVEALPTHPNEELYRRWAAEGWLTLLPGRVIDYDAIVEYVLGLDRWATVLRVGYDPWHAKTVVRKLESVVRRSGGDPDDAVRGVRQSIGEFTAAVESFEHGVKTGRIWLDSNPINAYCFANCVLMTDHNDNLKPTKRRANEKIDGAITALMALKMFIDYE